MPHLVIGFTGTRAGMTPIQAVMVDEILAANRLNIKAVRHGDCVGADEGFDALARAHLLQRWIHPPSDNKFRAYCGKRDPKNVVEAEPQDYLARDRIIVGGSDLLLATPKEDKRPRSLRGNGTWYTINYAQNLGTAVIVIPPRLGMQR